MWSGRGAARRVKIHYNYTVEEAARLLSVHRNTIRRWIKNGLPILSQSKPHLILGRDLAAFLEKASTRTTRLLPNQCYCVKCGEGRRPALDMADYVPITERRGNLRGICGKCGTLMHRHVSLDQLNAVAPDLIVKFMHAQPRISEPPCPSTNGDIARLEHVQSKTLRAQRAD
jgi:hypothetical protein